MLLSILFVVVFGITTSTPLIYCNQTGLLLAVLEACYSNALYANNQASYLDCMQNTLVQNDVTTLCFEDCLTRTNYTTLLDCSQGCCDSFCNKHGIGIIPQGCETVDPYLTIKIVILTSAFLSTIVLLFLGIKCFGKRDYVQNELTIRKIIHYHQSTTNFSNS